MPLSRSTRVFITFCVLTFSICFRTEVKAKHRTFAAWPSVSSESQVPQNPPPSCPVTQAPADPLVPPPPFSAKPGKGSFWFGSEKLWTVLDADGVWRGLHTE